MCTILKKKQFFKFVRPMPTMNNFNKIKKINSSERTYNLIVNK